MNNVQNEDRELISYGRRLKKIQSKIEQLNENLCNLSEQQTDIKNQINNKEKEVKKFNRIKQISKNITIMGSTLSLSSSAISGGLSLAGYSQEGGFLSLAGSATSGFFALVGSIVDSYFSIKETDAQESKAELEKKLETKLEEKFYRDRRRLRESWIELVDIYEDLYLLRHISKNFPVEVDKAFSNFVEALFKIKQGENKENNKLKQKAEYCSSSIMIQPVSTCNSFRPSTTMIQPVSQISQCPETAPVIKDNTLKDKELLKKWKENGSNIDERIKELVEKIGDYRQKLINQSKRYSLQFQNQPQPYQYSPLQPQPYQYPPLQTQPYQYPHSQTQSDQHSHLQSKPYQYPLLKPQLPLHSKPYPLKLQLYQYSH